MDDDAPGDAKVVALRPELPVWERVRKKFTGAGRVPVLGRTTDAMLNMLEDPTVSTNAVMTLIERDVALSTNVLAVANSPFYGDRGQVSSLSRAVSLLGFDAIRNIVFALSIHRLFRQGRICPGFDAMMLWDHSWSTGIAARCLASQLRPRVDAQQAFLAGLLHDVGWLLLIQLDREGFVKVIHDLEGERANSAHMQGGTRALEIQHLGITHCELAGEVLTRWNFPVFFIAAARYHHHPAAADEALATLVALIQVADFLASERKGASSLDLLTDAPHPDVIALAQVTPSMMEEARELLRCTVDPVIALFR